MTTKTIPQLKKEIAELKAKRNQNLKQLSERKRLEKELRDLKYGHITELGKSLKDGVVKTSKSIKSFYTWRKKNREAKALKSNKTLGDQLLYGK